MQFSKTIDAAFKREEERQARQIGQLHRFARAHVHCIAYEAYYEWRLEQLRKEYDSIYGAPCVPSADSMDGSSRYTEAMRALDESEARYCRRTLIEGAVIAVSIVALAFVAFSL